MPFRVGERYGVPNQTTITFMTSRLMSRLVRKAATARGLPSNASYINQVLMEAIAKDLGNDPAIDEARSHLPKPRHPKWQPGESGRSRTSV